MDSFNVSKDKNEELKHIKSNNLNNIKSSYILKNIFEYLSKYILLGIINYNKIIQNILIINIIDYKEYCEKSLIEIEIIPIKNKYGIFINIPKKEELYYHLYFNDNKEEVKRNYLRAKDIVTKIKIIIDYQVKSFENLFYYCECVELINFKNFHRNNIYSMRNMFSRCSSLKELNLSKFNTNNVNDMYSMFYDCS